MDAAKYRQILIEAQRDLGNLLAQKDTIDKAIVRLKNTITALSPLSEEKGPLNFLRGIAEETGLTDGCREILKTCGGFLTAVEVKERLVGLGYDLTRYRNPLASIHAVLKRLAAADAVDTTKNESGSTIYAWRDKNRVTALPVDRKIKKASDK